jgi:hypothetical protein
MKNFLIIVLALGLTAAAFATRPDREDFDRYLARQQKGDSTVAASSLQPIAIFRKAAGGTTSTANAIMTSAASAATTSAGKEPPVVLDPAKVEFKDFLLWTVVKQDGKTLYTGVFDHWIDNQQVRGMLPS